MWEYRANLVRVIDGDTLVILLDLGVSVRAEEHIRLVDVRAPEMSQPGGLETREYVKARMTQLPPLRWPLTVRTVPNTNPEPDERRTLVRYLGTVLALPGYSLNADVNSFLAEHPEWGTGM